MRLKEGQNDGKKIKITYNCCINEERYVILLYHHQKH